MPVGAVDDMNADVRKVIGILSIPRSGTTMLAAAFAAAPDVTAVYEPFNADKAERWREGTMTLGRLLEDYGVKTADRPALVVKETCAKFEYVKLMRDLLEDARPPRERSLLVILRNPLHCFLSEVQGRREWWDEPDLQITPQLFDRWGERTVRGLTRTFDLLDDVGGMCVSYSGLVRHPDHLTTILGEVGVTVTGDEETFYERMDTTKVRGDISLATNPRPMSTESEERRGDELAAMIERVEPSEWFETVQELVVAIDQMSLSVALPAAHPDVGDFHALLKRVVR